MAQIQSWGWFNYTGTWPGFSILSGNNLDHRGDGLSVDPAGYVEITLNDWNNDGIIYDADVDGGPINGGETVSGPSMTLTPHEVALYTGSTIVHNGTTYTVNMEVTLFTNGMYGVRLLDNEIPLGHHSGVTSITLGTWNEVEYSGIQVSAVDQMFVCYVAGTEIETTRGYVPIEQIKVGDFVETLDHGPQEVRWIGSQFVLGTGKNAPIRIEAGLFDNDVPVFVSPNHRILLHGEMIDMLFAADEVFAPAKALINGTTITQEPRALVHYCHFALDQHEIIMADGMLSESLLPGPETLRLIKPADRDALFDAIPRLEAGWDAYGPAARLCLTKRECELLRWANDRERQFEKLDSPRVNRSFEPN